jgi:hypothetical protein
MFSFNKLSLLPVFTQSLSHLLALHSTLLHCVLNIPFLFPLTSFASSSINTRPFPKSELVYLLSSLPQFVLPFGMYFNYSNYHLTSYVMIILFNSSSSLLCAGCRIDTRLPGFICCLERYLCLLQQCLPHTRTRKLLGSLALTFPGQKARTLMSLYIYVFTSHLTTMPVAETLQHQIIGPLENTRNKLRSNYLLHWFWTCAKGLRKTTASFCRDNRRLVEIQTEQFPNTCQK